MKRDSLGSVAGRKSVRSNNWYRKYGGMTYDHGPLRALIGLVRVFVIIIYTISALIIYTDAVLIIKIKGIIKTAFMLPLYPSLNIKTSHKTPTQTTLNASLSLTIIVVGLMCVIAVFIHPVTFQKIQSVSSTLLTKSSGDPVIKDTNNTNCLNGIGDRIRIRELEAVIMQLKSEIQEIKSYPRQKVILSQDITFNIPQTLNRVYLMINYLEDNLKELKKSMISKEIVEQIVNSALKLYDEDKIGLADYALYPAGGRVISIGNTKPYLNSEGKPFHSPNIMIQPDLQPGNCWAFEGRMGEVTIQGLDDIYAHEKLLLGSFTFEDSNHFPNRPFNLIKIIFTSNHGSSYTCVYRFRVHGFLEKSTL
ncbi:SUN domain-containing protein 1 [Trichoplax sp. H2]|nr:SUN domain-containing protein 1 [Trichoplax sp. H2]|eukprot:RDD41313.1 SUN domain-containing protein 1 [Trichoplax sp. H2]